jgi:c-di-GMP-binding flagellar brake protein YcgR
MSDQPPAEPTIPAETLGAPAEPAGAPAAPAEPEGSPANPAEPTRPSAKQAKPTDAAPGKAEEARRIERLPGVHLDLKIGGALRLHFPTLGKKYEGKVVGFEPYSFLIVLARLPQEVLVQAAAGAGLVVQHEAGGMVFGFRSEILKHITSPAALLFLGFPDSVDRIVLRRDARVSVNLPGTLNGKYGEQKVMVQDLTLTGCQLTAKVDLKTPLREAQVGDRLVLNCEMGCSLPIIAPIELRRVETEKGLLHMGAQFVEISPETEELLQGFIGGLLEFLGHAPARA